MKKKAQTFFFDNTKPSVKGNIMIILNPVKVKSIQEFLSKKYIIYKNPDITIEEILEKYKASDNYIIGYKCCEGCNGFIKWAKYERTVIYRDKNGKLVKKRITIQRVKCKKCGRTHALLPSFIVPYKIYLLDVILSSLMNDEETYDISIDTVNVWIKQFKTFLPMLKTMFNNISTKEVLERFQNKIFEYYESFYTRFKKILMMTHLGICHKAYFKIGHPHNFTFFSSS